MTAMRTMGLAPALPPDATVTETTSEYVVSLAVPGFAQQELEVELAGRFVTIRGDQTRTSTDGGPSSSTRSSRRASVCLPMSTRAA